MSAKAVALSALVFLLPFAKDMLTAFLNKLVERASDSFLNKVFKKKETTDTTNHSSLANELRTIKELYGETASVEIQMGKNQTIRSVKISPNKSR
ncbi:hypothetical protein CVD28_24515 [Bacillus sp. M6-12]|uniref:hypothetical protein n=1 Tax=Bacillus sp. M6-12 TaxID=2054166 RepID=UPI000C787E23|nr:hypothetical protein [Bacillus sp. M6-12]PLS15047.1 hypothetical protein CVD28_24515 [Bacillus sp. M6-12]